MKKIENNIKDIFIKNNGFASLKELTKNKVHTSYIKYLLDNNIIEKIKPGLYKLTDFDYDSNSSYIEICKAIPSGVICCITALNYYELTTHNSYIIDVAIPNSKKANKIIYPPVKFHYFRDKTYNPGINEINTKIGRFKIYDKEKTICDVFRNRRYYGESLIIESLKEYLKIKDKNINKLYDYAEKCRIKKIIFQYLKIMSG